MNSERVLCEFKNQKVAKACADKLNEYYWKDFDRARKLGIWPNDTMPFDMIELIRDYSNE